MLLYVEGGLYDWLCTVCTDKV